MDDPIQQSGAGMQGMSPQQPPPPTPQSTAPPSQYSPPPQTQYAPPPPQAQAPQGSYGQMSGIGGGAGPPSPPTPPSKPANFQLGTLLPPVLKVKVPTHPLTFDEQYFLHLLAGSISLTKDEKMRIIESIPKLKQSQIDELIRIFEEERKKFAELGEEHVPQLEKLVRQHYEDWVDIEMHQEQSSKASEDAKKAEDLRKQFGL